MSPDNNKTKTATGNLDYGSDTESHSSEFDYNIDTLDASSSSSD